MKKIVLESILILFFLAFLMGARINGCAPISPVVPEKPERTGKLILLITDKPIVGEEVKEIRVTISQVMVHKAALGEEIPSEELEEAKAIEVQPAEEEEMDETWIDVPVKQKEFDLIALSSVEELLGEVNLEPGRYTQIRLTVNAGNLKVKKDGEKSYDLKLVGKSRLKIVRSFEIVEEEITELLLDFNAEKSLKKTGKSVYLLKPVIKLVREERKPSVPL